METNTLIALAANAFLILHLACAFTSYNVARDNYVNHIYGFIAGLLFGPIGVLMVEHVPDGFSLERFVEKDIFCYNRNQVTDEIELYKNSPLMETLYIFLEFQTRATAQELEMELRMGNMRFCRLVYNYLRDMENKTSSEAANVTRMIWQQYKGEDTENE